MKSKAFTLGAAACAALSLSVLIPEPAEARRGGSFGSRGARTYQAPPPTRTAPEQTAPVQRSMTAPPTQGASQAQPAAARPAAAANAASPQRRGFMGGLGGGILGGLLAGGLIGMLLGNGFGAGMAGFMSLLVQVAVIGLIVWLGFKLFRRRPPAMAGHAGQGGWPGNTARFEPAFQPASSGTYSPVTAAAPTMGIAVTNTDRQGFERLLGEVQDAFAREDYAALRERTTPEVMSYLAEELSQNALRGVRNEVRDTQLLEADVAEAWREGEREFATAAMRYQNIDVLRDRTSGDLVEGDPDRATETTELWTFVRAPGEDWKLSAIQEA